MNNFYMIIRPLALAVHALAATIFVAGCALIPSYELPPSGLPVAWPTSAKMPTPSTQNPVIPSWQDYFSDTTLRQLIGTALDNNRDLRVTLLNTQQAKAQLGIRQADQFPTINTTVTGARTPTSAGGINSAYSAGLAVTAYEFDFFGRVASLKEQALAQYLATTEAVQTAQIGLIATVAQSWLSLLADEALLTVTQQTLATRAESVKLVELKLAQGAASELDHRLAQTLLEAARVTLAQFARQRALDENALVLLLGQSLNEAQRAQLRQTSLEQLQFAELLAGLPSDLLAQRPDIRQAEQVLIASNANIGAARAAFFPRISLTTGLGSASSELGGLFKDGAWGWTLAPQLVLPIFDGGRNQSNLDAAKAGRDIALAQYEKAIQSAFREVGDTLASRATLVQQLQASRALQDAETDRSRLTQLRLEHGAANQLEWLDAKRSLFAAQQGSIQTQLAYLQNQIALFKALGGGASVQPVAAKGLN